jgi:hypothetical protein
MMKNTSSRPNWFETLNASLDSEGLIESWDCSFSPIRRGETRSYHYDNGTRYGHWVSIYRDEMGRYERPVHYSRG